MLTPFDREAFRAHLHTTLRLADSTTRQYARLAARFVEAGHTMKRPPPEFGSAMQRAAWNAYVAWSSGSSVAKVLQEVLDDLGPEIITRALRPVIVARHLDIVGRLERGEADVWGVADLSEPHRLYAKVLPWLRAAHEREGLVAIPEYKPTYVQVDPDMAHVARTFYEASGDLGRLTRWRDLRMTPRMSLFTHHIGNHEINGGALWALAQRQADPDACFSCESLLPVLVDVKGAPIDGPTWRIHSRSSVNLPSRLPPELLARFNPRVVDALAQIAESDDDTDDEVDDAE